MRPKKPFANISEITFIPPTILLLFLFYGGWKQIRKRLSLINVMFFSVTLERSYFFPPHSFVHNDTSHSTQTSSPQKEPSRQTDSPYVEPNCPWHSGARFGLACTEDWAKMTIYSPDLGLRAKANKKATSNTISCSSDHLCLWLISGEQRACVCTALERPGVCNPLISFFSFFSIVLQLL